jgi:hypothetical protein
MSFERLVPRLINIVEKIRILSLLTLAAGWELHHLYLLLFR